MKAFRLVHAEGGGESYAEAMNLLRVHVAMPVSAWQWTRGLTAAEVVAALREAAR
jgi:hypothetical protein